MADPKETPGSADSRRSLVVPLFDLAELPSREASPRPRRTAGTAPAGRDKPPQAKPARGSARREPAWTPEGEVRRRLAALLAEAEAARRSRAAAATPSWEQLILPGYADLKGRPATPRR